METSEKMTEGLTNNKPARGICSTGEGCRSHKSLACWHKYPVINFFYDMLFDEVPTVDNVKELHNLFGLMSALLLAVVMAVPASVEYDELVAVDERFVGTNASYADVWSTIGNMGCDTPSAMLAVLVSNAIVIIFCVLAFTILGYIDVINKNFEPEELVSKLTAEQASQITKRISQGWWKYHRLLIAFNFLLLFIGVIYCLLSTWFLFVIKFPDYQAIKEQNVNPSDRMNSPYGYYTSLQVLLYFGMLLVSIVMGLGTAAYYNTKAYETDTLVAGTHGL